MIRFPPLAELVLVCVIVITTLPFMFMVNFVADYTKYSSLNNSKSVLEYCLTHQNVTPKRDSTFALDEPIDTESDIAGKWKLYHHLRKNGLDNSHISGK